MDDVERLRHRLPGDALAYALVRPGDLREALNEIGRRLDPLDPRWGEPGVLWRESAEALGVSELEALVGADPDPLVGVALIRTSASSVKGRRDALRRASSRGTAPECPVTPRLHIARLADSEHASPPAAWRLPAPPSRSSVLLMRCLLWTRRYVVKFVISLALYLLWTRLPELGSSWRVWAMHCCTWRPLRSCGRLRGRSERCLRRPAARRFPAGPAVD